MSYPTSRTSLPSKAPASAAAGLARRPASPGQPASPGNSAFGRSGGAGYHGNATRSNPVPNSHVMTPIPGPGVIGAPMPAPRRGGR